ncbi:hypothetical protein CLV98_101170 [Dyadobacter jejuensis]|uniref:Secreted protein (Por secretion system target) n=1 Tax=Dyadobacter jejuensis TaxID=1082580 RepID=A0A316AQH7_9BACT|nr:hypothetical protein [Dyadobacter jejuensis]PWJ59995.1 hypothetical protein CLV98_101170 [Dyadobacter jejuensis]
MKKFNSMTRSLALLGLLLMGWSVTALAQDKAYSKIRIKITDQKEGKTEDKIKEYKLPPMTEKDQQVFIDKVLDSLGVDDQKQLVSITIEDNHRRTAGESHRESNRRSADEDALAYHWDDLDKDWDLAAENIKSQMRHFERSISPKARTIVREMENIGDRMGRFWSEERPKPSAISGLSVYANKPNDGQLNIRFHALQKGDVHIRVTDTKGKDVGDKSLKDYQGEFVGQIELKRQAKGTLFVMVTQNEDGTVKRYVLPE